MLRASTPWILLAFAACSGGGGAPPGANVPATLIAAAWLPSVTPPTLELTFDEALANPRRTPTAADFVVEAGQLGTVTGVRFGSSGQVLVLVLAGDGALAPGTTRIGVAADRNALVDTGGLPVASGATVPLRTGGPRVATVTAMTIDGIEPELNGEGQAGGTLQVPTTGFRVDLQIDDPGQVRGLTLHASGPAAVQGVLLAAGQDLSATTNRLLDLGAAFAEFGAALELTEGPLELTAVVIDDGGRATRPRTFRLLVIRPTDDVRPFEADQLWWLDTSRDVEHFVVEPLGGVRFSARIVVTPNGIPDFEDTLRVGGLLPPVGAAGGDAIRAALLHRLQDEALRTLQRLHDATRINFTFEQPGPVPPDTLQLPFGEFPFSVICVGGAPGAEPTGALGQAIVDPHNRHQDFNCALDFRSMPQFPPSRLGVFPHSTVDDGLQSPPGSLFRQLFGALIAELGGTPIGMAADGMDLERLGGASPGGDPTRTDQIDRALTAFVNVLAVVIAHECGHSHGMVIDGPMPGGLYGGMREFIGSRTGHIDARSLFPPGAQNIMAPGISFDEPQHEATGFNSLNKAWLGERALYGER